METKKIIVLIVMIILIIVIGYYLNYINKKNKKKSEYIEQNRRDEKLKREELKENNSEEYERILKKEENESEERRKKNKLWKDTRVGVYIFMGIHLIIEILFSEGIGTSQPNPGVSVVFNFVISRYFIKRSIFKKNKIIDKPIIYGIGISLIVFCFRFLLGVISYLFTS